MMLLIAVLSFAGALAVAGAAIDSPLPDELPLPTEIIDIIEPTPSPDVPDQDSVPVPDYVPESSPTPNIAGESESLGTFGTDDTIVNDALDDLFNDVGDSGFDFVTPDLDYYVSPTPFLEPSPTPDYFDFESGGDDDVNLYANYDTYYGAISTTYLEYMRGFLPKLGFKEHYVASRTGQYTYIFAYGEDLFFNGSSFVGTSVTVITWNTYNNGSYSIGYESSFSLNPASYLVYSDLSKVYPSLADAAGFTLRQILILLTTFVLGIVIDHMYQVRKIRRIK